MTRSGVGYDAHPLAQGRELVLGGVTVSYDRGLEGHSDGDVLSHAVIDALFGAAALGDIGAHFPPSGPNAVPQGVSSIALLEQAMERVRAAGYRLENVDATIIAQRPALAPSIPAMRAALARALGADENQVNVKATTEDGMGYTGASAGIAAIAVAAIERV